MREGMEFELRRLRDQIDAVLAMAALPGTMRTLESDSPYRLEEGFDYRIGDFLIKVVRKEIIEKPVDNPAGV